jgi:hypothetical protein
MGYSMLDIHNIPIKIKKHAARALVRRFKLDVEEAEHYIKIACIVKPVEKDGNIGILQSNIGNCKIQFVCTIRENILYIITVEECK